MDQISMFGCRIDAVGMGEAVETLRRWIAADGGPCRYVVTPNVHHTVLLQHHDGLRRAYAEASLVLADGMPIVWAARMLRRRAIERVTGSDLAPALFDRCRRDGLRVFLLGAAEGVAERAATRIEGRWPGIRVVGTLSPPMGFERDPNQNEAILRRVAEARPDVLVIGLGAPKQELWAHAHRNRIEARVALCVGATIDFLAEHVRRAPIWIQNAGFEWAYRFAQEPRRLGGRYLRDAWAFAGLLGRESRRNGARDI